MHQIEARQTQIVTRDEQRGVHSGKRASAGFCGGNAGKIAVSEMAHERRGPLKRHRSSNPVKRTGHVRRRHAASSVLGSPVIPG